MCPISPLTDSHHSRSPSTQKSLVSACPKISVSAPVASTKIPSGVHFLRAGGSWSQAFSPRPCESVLPFSPPRIVPLVHLRLGVHRDLQRLRVVLVLPAAGLDVGEDGGGLREPLERLGLLDPLEPVAQAVEDVAQA